MALIATMKRIVSLLTPAENRAPVAEPLSKTINQPFLGNAIRDVLPVRKGLIVKAPMGCGKTTAIKNLLNDLGQQACFAIVTPREKLNRAMAKELGASFYKDVLSEPNRANAEIMAQRVVGTLQFFRTLLNEFPALRNQYQFVVMDESQSIATLLVDSITKHQEEVLDATKQICQHAQHVIAMDAHAGRETDSLMRILLNDEAPFLLINEAKPWHKINVDLLTGKNYIARQHASNTLQIEAINADKRIVICSSNASYCESRYDVLVDMHPDKHIGIITAKNTPEAQALMEQPDHAIEKCEYREIMQADRAFIRHISKQQLSSSISIISSEHNLLLLHKLLSYTEDYRDGTPYTHQHLRNGKLVKFVCRHYQEIVALDVIDLPKQWKRKPALLINLLLKKIGYRVKNSRKANGKRNKNGIGGGI